MLSAFVPPLCSSTPTSTRRCCSWHAAAGRGVGATVTIAKPLRPAAPPLHYPRVVSAASTQQQQQPSLSSSSSSGGLPAAPASSSSRGRRLRQRKPTTTSSSDSDDSSSSTTTTTRARPRVRRPASSPRSSSPRSSSSRAPAAAAVAQQQHTAAPPEEAPLPQQPVTPQAPPPPPLAQQQQQQQHPGAPSPALSSALPPAQLAQLRRYLNHMLEVNRSMNLTAIRDPAEAWQRHIEDSLALLPVIEQHAAAAAAQGASAPHPPQQQHQQQQHDPSSLSLVDVGTGAGLPGMVLAVVRPAWRVTLVDSLRKRCAFLEQTAGLLGLSNVRVVWSRAEDAGRRDDLRDAHDVAVARAVAELRVLAELCLPLVAPGGLWVAAKGAHPQAEVAAAGAALAQLKGRLLDVALVDSWAPEGQRTAVVVRKQGPTPRAYPRTPGTPSKKPL